MGKSKPIFVVGCFRSGTTLMRRTLNTSDVIYVSRETGFLPSILEKKYSGKKFARYINSYLKREKWDYRLGLGKFHEWTYTESDLFDVYKEICCAESEGVGELCYWGDNTPMNVFVLYELYNYFPDAKFIYMYRDPRDVISSAKSLKFGASSVDKLAIQWLFYVTSWVFFRDKLIQDGADAQFVEIKYEDFVRNPSKIIKKLGLFLNVELSEDYEIDTSVSGIAHHSRISDPIDSASVGRFQNDLSIKEIMTVENVLRIPLRSYGYALDGSYGVTPVLKYR